MIKKISAIALSCVLLATSCSNINEKSIDATDQSLKKAEEGLSKLRGNESLRDVSAVRHSDRVWLGSRGYRQQNGDPLPNKYDNLTYISSQEQSLSDIASDLAAMTGMRFVVRNAAAGSSSSGSEIDGGMDLGGGSSSSSSGGNTCALSYSGDFVGLLNQLSTKFDMFWEHRENVIYLSKYVTRTLALYSLPSTTTLSAEITSASDSTESGGGEGGGSESGTDNTVSLESTLNVWEEIGEVVESMLPEGSDFAMSPSTGTLTLTSSPLAIRKVENLIKKQNEILSRQVVVDVNVMSIVTSELDRFQVDFSSILKNVSDKFDLSWSGPSGNLTEMTGLGSFSSGYFSNSTEFDAEGNLISGNIANLMIDALSERFTKSMVTNSSVTTLNNHAVPLQIITSEAYLKEMELSVDEGSVTSSATPGNITTGFVMNILPRILANGDVMMQYSMSLSEKTALEKIEFMAGTDASGNPLNSFIQLPTVVSRDFLQNVKLRSGNTLILSGFDRYINSAEDAGVGNPDLWLFGGGEYGKMKKEVLVIFMTPRIIE